MEPWYIPFVILSLVQSCASFSFSPLGSSRRPSIGHIYSPSNLSNTQENCRANDDGVKPLESPPPRQVTF